jgi:putative oxidoreductase
MNAKVNTQMNTQMNTQQNLADLSGRVLIAWIFLRSGLDKIGGYGPTQAYMEATGVPGALLPAVIALEVLGAAAIIAGWRTRLVAALLAGFSLVAAVLFHHVPGDQMQSILFLKNVAIAGGFLVLVARGAGNWSFDARRARLPIPKEA